MTNLQSNADGTLHDDELRWLERRAAGGFGMVMTCAAHVAREGQCWPGQLGVWHDKFIPGLTRLADTLKANGAVSSVQLHHGGLRASSSISGVPTVAPWMDHQRRATALTTSEVRDVVRRFTAAARRVERAGFDGVELHGAHGYLLSQFLDGSRNVRTDGYGGTLGDRMRVLIEALEGIRGATGPDFQVGLRLSPHRYGIVLDEAVVVAEHVMASGVIDYLDMSLWDVRTTSTGQSTDRLTLTEVFAALPRGATRLGVAGKIHSAETAQWCLDQGVDFVLVGTSAIVHHDFARRIMDDSRFASVSPPFSRHRLETEAVGSRFIDYLATDWDDFVR